MNMCNLGSDTTISRRKCTNPSDLVSQATKSLVSTVVGDHTGILGVVFFHFFLTPGRDEQSIGPLSSK